MLHRFFIYLISYLILSGVLSFTALGQSRIPADADLTPEEQQQEILLRYMESNIPGPETELLLALNGNWVTEMRNKLGPEFAASTAEGNAEVQVMLGGRFVQIVQEGEIRDFPFQSLQFLGFGGGSNPYFLHIFDTFGKNGVVLRGVFQPKTNRIRFQGNAYDPVLRTQQNYEVIIQFIAPHEFVIQTYLDNSKVGGGPYLAQEVRFVRN